MLCYAMLCYAILYYTKQHSVRERLLVSGSRAHVCNGKAYAARTTSIHTYIYIYITLSLSLYIYIYICIHMYTYDRTSYLFLR